MNEILQKRIIDKANAIINFNLVDLNDLVNQHDLFKMLIEIAAFALQNQWISVEEALPEYEEVVMVIDGTDEDNLPVTAHRSPNKSDVVQDSHEFCLQWIGQKITHWMEIPQLKGGEK